MIFAVRRRYFVDSIFSNDCWKKITIEPVVFLYMLAISMNIPTDEALLYRQVCFKFYNESICSSMIHHLSLPVNIEHDVQKSTSIYLIYFSLIYSIPSIFISILCSSWSEKYSHKIPLILANGGCILASVVNLFISTRRNTLSIEYFVASNIFISFFGSSSTMFSIVYNYMARITEEHERTWRIAILESSLLFGSTIGLIFSGFLLDFIDFPSIFLLIIGLHIINILYIIVFVDEIIDTHQSSWSLKRFCHDLSICKEIHQSFFVLIKPREKQRRKYLLLSLIGLLLSL